MVYLNLPSSSLQGTVTPLLFSMPFLTYLNLSGNSLQGSFPDNSSTSFKVLDLSFNNFNGSIPASIGNLANLEWLDLSENDLAGRIPPQLGNLTNLIHLDLVDNFRLEGELPAGLGACTKLTFFQVGLSATVFLANGRGLISGPSQAAFAIFSNMSSLNYLAIRGTLVKGSIPAEIGSLKTLVLLDLGGNFLQGEIPRTLGNLSKLQGLFLEFGDFTGPLPGELGSCTQLQVLQVGMSSDPGQTYGGGTAGSYFPNKLNGSIPESFGQLQNLRELFITHTQMGGKIPSLSNATSLRLLDLEDNQFTGHIPSSFPSLLTQLYLEGNRLSGPIPPAIGNLSYLTDLQIYEDLEGSIPPELGFCQNLLQLDVGSSDTEVGTNNLTGSIPQEFGRLNQLQSLQLADTQLSGTIPSSLGNCSSLTILVLRDSRLVGSLPPELANLTALQALYLDRNRLEGSLSALPWDRLKSLAALDLSENILSGTIPESLGSAVSLWYFGASSNQLVGTLPRSFINCSSLAILDLQSNQLEGNITGALDVLPGSSMWIILLASNRFDG